jgi:hypothetical protein
MKTMMITMTSLQDELNSQKRHVEMIKDLLLVRKEALFFEKKKSNILSSTRMEKLELVDCDGDISRSNGRLVDAISKNVEEKMEIIENYGNKSKSSDISYDESLTATVGTELNNVSVLNDEEVERKKERLTELYEDDSSSFSSAVASSDDMAYFIQNLVFHRVMMSPIDSIYCTKFVKLLHDLRIPNFSLFEFYHKFFSFILPLLFSITECEASFLAYAIDDILTVINRWQSSQSLFQLEAIQNNPSNTFHLDFNHQTVSEDEKNAGVTNEQQFRRFTDLCKVFFFPSFFLFFFLSSAFR